MKNMKVSGFTFLRNGEKFGYPFVQSILSALPIVDEFIIALGKSEDDTLTQVKAINSPKIKILETEWNDRVTHSGFVYGQQKMIAQYACTGDWLLYLEADELLHEKDYPAIQQSMIKHLDNPHVEALVFDYWHFYGNTNTYAWSPAWYRRAPRIIKSSIRSYAPDGLFWVVLDKNNKKGRYPRAALVNAHVYHYGWARSPEHMEQKFNHIQHYWSLKKNLRPLNAYTEIDPDTLHLFEGTHPHVLGNALPKEKGLFQANPYHHLTKREKKNRIGLLLEKWFHLELSKKHFSLLFFL